MKFKNAGAHLIRIVYRISAQKSYRTAPGGRVSCLSLFPAVSPGNLSGQGAL